MATAAPRTRSEITWTGAASTFRLVVGLFKLRIASAIALACLAGAAVAPGPPPALGRRLMLALAVGLTAAAAGAFNQYAERDLDARMPRTRRRAFASGRLQPGSRWLWAIAAVGTVGVVLADVAANAAAAVYTFLGGFTYAVVYTWWLKRRSRWNIVVGGLAGSFAVLAGAAATAAGPWPAPLPMALAIVLFLWTPPHFWSLAIAYRDEYAAAGIPMLPVVVGKARCARAVFAGACLLVAASLAPVLLGSGPLYLAAAVGGGALLLRRSSALLRSPDRQTAMANFHASLLQLGMLLTAAIAGTAMSA
jgi:protoheme IX farnesyltransferase